LRNDHHGARLPNVEQVDTVAVALRREITKRGLSQAEAARELDVHPSRLNRWLLDGLTPEPNSYETLMKFLNVDKATFAVMLFESGAAHAKRRGRL
jgi:transcriptional regulator with XRE-family HTH domain